MEVILVFKDSFLKIKAINELICEMKYFVLYKIVMVKWKCNPCACFSEK